MKKYHVLALLCLAGVPAYADIEDPCNDLWFSRNAMLDQAGYCFSSPLGKAIFDNSDCTTKQPKLTAQVKAQIALIKKYESDDQSMYGRCDIDNQQRKLYVPDVKLRKQLEFQPATDGGIMACLGYLGRDAKVYAAPSKNARPMGKITKGDVLSLGHVDWREWTFLTVTRGKKTTTLGWVNTKFNDEKMCSAWAG